MVLFMMARPRFCTTVRLASSLSSVIVKVGRPRSPGDNHIVLAKIRETDKELLALVDAALIVDDDHGLPYTFVIQYRGMSDMG